MKKLYIAIIALFIAGAVDAQSQRIVLTEEFTNASCPPCAAQNPAFNALLQANPTKTVAIKYQTNWPGVDPMNAQTQSMVGPRVTYYGVTGVPHGVIDGTPIANTCNAYVGAPACLTQATIDNRYATPSPFDLAVSHVYSTNYDSITITIQATCTQAVSGNLVLQTGIVENTIRFAAAPGANGETQFYNVMRQMLPNSTGTALAGAWTVGQTQTFTFSVPVPSYVYNKNEMGVIAFIQDNATKAVHQAGYSAPQPLGLDASIASYANVVPLSCTSTFDPSLTLTNTGLTALTAVDFSYKVNNGTATAFSWTGNLAAGASTSVVFPTQTLTAGNNTFNASITAVNGIVDNETANNTFTSSVNANLAAPLTTPVVQGFTTNTFPPLNWNKVNGGSTYTWVRYSVGSTGLTGSAKMAFWNAAAGDVDELISAKVDLSTANAPTLNFKIAKAYYTGLIDQLDVLASSDCGVTWTNIWSKAEPQLNTVGANTTAEYIVGVTAAGDWRTETANLSSFVGQPEVLINFRATSAYGNDLYLDDINIQSAVGIAELGVQPVKLFPVPSNGKVNVSLEGFKSSSVEVTITDIQGKLVQKYSTTSRGNQLELNLSSQPNGTYFVQLTSGEQSVTRKVEIEK